MRYPAHAAFFQPAQKRSAIWRLLLGIIVVGLVFALWLGGSFGLLRFLVGPENIESWGERLRAPTSPFETYLVLSTFLGMVVATLAAALLLHRRGLLSLIGLNGRIRTDFIAGAGIAFAILLISIALFLIRYIPEPNLSLPTWALLLPLSLLVIFIQSGAEELLFRGYLQQQLAARFASLLIWMLIPSALFGLAHFDPSGSGLAAPLVLAATFIFGLCAADLTAKTGSIAAAWGFHFANNCVALLAISLPGSISGLALYLTPFRAEDTEVVMPMILLDIAVTILIWAVLRRALQR